MNRINIMARAAVRSLGDDWKIWHQKEKHTETSFAISRILLSFFKSRLHYFMFESILFTTSIGFYMTRIAQWCLKRLGYASGGGFESMTDKAVKLAIEEKFGLEIDETVFDG